MTCDISLLDQKLIREDDKRTRILITHAERRMDTFHTSWNEILGLKESIEYKFGDIVDVQMKDVSSLKAELHVNRQTLDEAYDVIFIFCSSHTEDFLIDQLNDSLHVSIFAITQDPNWPVDFQINRDYTWVTPFRSLQHKSLEYCIQYTSELLPDFKMSKPSKHIYYPFGLMSFISKSLKNRYCHPFNFMSVRSLKLEENHFTNHKMIYAGSLKKDRGQLFKDLLLEQDFNVDFYGNYAHSQMENLTGLQGQIFADNIKGWSPCFAIPLIYSCYKAVALLPDYKMINLDVSYARYAEIYYASVKNDELMFYLKTDEEDQVLARMIIKSFSTELEKNYFKIDKKRLIDYFKDDSLYIEILKSLKTNF